MDTYNRITADSRTNAGMAFIGFGFTTGVGVAFTRVSPLASMGCFAVAAVFLVASVVYWKRSRKSLADTVADNRPAMPV